MMVISMLLFERWLPVEVMVPFVSPKSRGMLMRRCSNRARLGRLTVLGVAERMRLLTLVVSGLILMHGVTCLVFVGFGIPLCWSCTDFFVAISGTMVDNDGFGFGLGRN